MSGDLTEKNELKKLVNTQRNLAILFVLLTVVSCLSYNVIQLCKLTVVVVMYVVYCTLVVYTTVKYFFNLSNLSKCYAKTPKQYREGISASELAGVMVIDLAIIFLMIDTLTNLFRKVLGKYDGITEIEYTCVVIAVSLILIVFRTIAKFSFRRVNSN